MDRSMIDLDNPADTDVLVVIDPQVDFCPGGALAVPEGDQPMDRINALAERFAHVVLTQDWHPRGHISFASTHGAAPFSQTVLPYGDQVLWPDHCVQGEPGAEFHHAIRRGALVRAEVVLRKGYHQAVDSYSAFFENDRTTHTGLAGYLRERGLKRCVFVGLALDYCVRYSAEDALAEGFEAVLIADATRAIDPAGGAAAVQALAAKGALIV
ncbi:MAG TPA: bifunctional nicotinamidase/pyrazinamidase [Phenylobacterium sp.]